ncbi:MAG: alpha/beta hydrolase [Pseudonocardiales bacterium]|nr:MAG: alpha/beta hydrolase [Pseudonocardiales bacterium]
MRLEVEAPGGPAWVDLERPKGKPAALIAIGHGAGGGVETRDLLAVCDAALAAGCAVARITQPYRVAGRRSPAPAPRLDEAWLAAISAVRAQRGLRAVPLITAGRSSGARVACRTATDSGAIAVVALAFPVHPPGKPEKSRLDELALPTVPVLVVQGDRDAFGMPPPDAAAVVVIPGADHSLKKDPAAVAAAVVAFLSGL